MKLGEDIMNAVNKRKESNDGEYFKILEPGFADKCHTKDYGELVVFDNIITQSKKMMEVFEFISCVLDIDTTILIYGETGTGKDLLANAIHISSRRREKPFVAVNCAAIPDELFESELFGFKKGTFTGACEDRRGLFQMANGGTILLDEIGEIPLKVQSKLLRVIEEKKVTSLGSEKGVNIDVRIIAATNRDLELETEKGNFREDLFYRLNIIPIKLPALRERKEDIPLLARFFLEKYTGRLNKQIKSISQEAMNSLISHSWPGNVRELNNIIERAVVLEKKEVITDIGTLLTRKNGVSFDFTESFKVTKTKVMENLEKTYFSRLLEIYSGNVSQAAKHADMDLKNFHEKMNKHGIKRDSFLR